MIEESMKIIETSMNIIEKSWKIMDNNEYPAAWGAWPSRYGPGWPASQPLNRQSCLAPSRGGRAHQILRFLVSGPEGYGMSGNVVGNWPASPVLRRSSTPCRGINMPTRPHATPTSVWDRLRHRPGGRGGMRSSGHVYPAVWVAPSRYGTGWPVTHPLK